MNDMDVNTEEHKETEDSFDSDFDLPIGVAPTVTVHTSPMLKTEFAPWHKPRKQWIRDNQWNYLSSAIAKALKLKEKSRSLNYLSLPGVDLLDIRALEETCNSLGVKLKFLGLNYIEEDQQEQQAEQALSLNEVRSLDYVDQESTLLTERFEDLCDPKSIVSQQVLEECKTYDVINIDLCASFAKHKPGTWGSLYTALHKLLVHQVFYRTEPWVFLITTRTDKRKVDPDAFVRLINSVLESVDPAIISEYLEGKMGISPKYIEARQITQEALTTVQHMNCFTASFGIWKLRLLIDGDYKTKSHMHPPFSYHVESTDSVPDMTSMSFWCTRLPPASTDPAGLSASNGGSVGRADHKEIFQSYSKKALESSINGVDLDVLLTEKPGDYAQALERSKSLLRKARYSLDKYDDWVTQQQDKISSMIAGRQAPT